MKGIYFKSCYFNPGLLPSIVTIALLYLMISLGFWQLDRAEYKAKLQTIIETRQSIEAIALSDIGETPDEWLYQPVFTYGNFDVSHQLYLDNQVNNRTPGYSVFTPLKLSANLGILVNRGWVPLGKSRAILPDIRLYNNTDSLKISGILAEPPAKGLVLSAKANPYNSWPVVVQYIETAEISKQLGYRLLPMVIIINDKSHTSLDIKPVTINMRSEKHTAYAFQWFALSLALLIIYIVTNSKQNKDRH